MRRSRLPLLLLLVALTSLALPSMASAQNSFDCEDFSSQEEAQAELDSGAGDPNILDRDDNGVACQTFDYGDEASDDFTDASADAYARTYETSPSGGVASGGGSTADGGGLSPLPLLVGSAAFAALALATSVGRLRRRFGDER